MLRVHRGGMDPQIEPSGSITDVTTAIAAIYR